MILNALSSSLILIDEQEKLMPAISNREQVIDNSIRLIKAADHLSVPIVITEQYSPGLGLTVSEVSDATHGSAQIIDKTSFSAMKDETFKDYISELSKLCRQSFILVGCEAHVCVLQTALEIKAAGHEVFIVTDSVGSRDPKSVETAFARMSAAGIHLVTTEMVLFEWIERYDCKAFKALRELIV